MRRVPLAVLSAFLMGVMACVVASPSFAGSANGEASLVGKECPKFRGNDFDGKEFTLPAKRKGSVEVVNFWGIRCSSCLDEMSKLDLINKKHGARGLTIYGVNVDGAAAGVIAGLMKKMDLSVSYRLLPDADFAIMDSFRVTSTPFTVIVDDTGRIVYTHEGYKEGDETEIEAQIEKRIGAGK